MKYKSPYTKEQQEFFMQLAVQNSMNGIEKEDGGPFGCVIVKDGEVIASANNEVLKTNDPTAHAEVVAIRRACESLKTFQLTGCEVYASCEPCPMCLGAIYWARPDALYFSNTRQDAANIGFDDAFIYEEINESIEHRSIPTFKLKLETSQTIFDIWKAKENKGLY
jgi:tRNA(Arg) A34 adenosine deaminase TadA